jgi:uncharacterized protein (TIGR03086 family)
MDIMTQYRRALDGLDTMLAAVPADRWDAPSACAQWTVRDVAGHVIWGQHQVRAWATGKEYTQAAGAPGAPRPSEMVGADPVAEWRAAREASVPALTEQALARTITLRGIGDIPLAGILPLMITDTTTHTWDIGHALDLDVRLDPELVTLAFDWARANVVRAPGFFGPELTPPTDADEQTRMLAYLGRAAWHPAAT